jgi:hypothetical protein
VARSIPGVSFDPNVDTGGWSVSSVADTVFTWIADHPVPVVILVIAALLTKWLSKPLMKGLILGLIVAAIVFYAMGG